MATVGVKWLLATGGEVLCFYLVVTPKLLLHVHVLKNGGVVVGRCRLALHDILRRCLWHQRCSRAAHVVASDGEAGVREAVLSNAGTQPESKLLRLAN